MTRKIIFAILSILSPMLYAADFMEVLGDNAQWSTYMSNHRGRFGEVLELESISGRKHRIAGDTIICGKRCKIVESKYIDRPEITPTYSYWHEEDGRLFTFFDDSMWDIIKDKPEILKQHDLYYPFFLKMDMNLEIGESPYGSLLSVIGVDFIEIEGQLRKRISLGIDGSVVCTWIEGIMPENDINDTYSAWWPIPISYRIFILTSYTCEKFTTDATIYGAMGNTVREDRVWEYEDISITNEGTPHMGLSGVCYFRGLREFDGILYKILNCYHDNDNEDNDMAFLREKDRKVYVRLPADDKTNISENNKTHEALLYDFNANPGDTYLSLNFIKTNHMRPQPVKVTVTDTCSVEVGNRLMKCQIVKAADNDTELTVAEGIGIINGGWLHRPFWTKPLPDELGEFSQLNNVKNRFKMDSQLEDEILFKNRESLWKPQFIRNDRVWEYVIPVKGENPISIYCRMKFDGRKDVNGKMYEKFITLDIKKVERRVEGSDTICTMTYLPYEYVERLMREEGNTVFYLSQAETDLPEGGDKFNAVTWDFGKPIKEHPFYDFSPEIDYCFVGTTCLDCTANFWIKDITEVMVDGKSCRLLYAPKFGQENGSEYTYPNLYFLESVGAIGKGASMTHIPKDDSTEWFTLSRVFNAEGKQIFPIEGQQYPLGWNTGFIPDEEGSYRISSAGTREYEVPMSHKISYFNGIVSAPESHLIIYDIAGKIIKEGVESLQTDDLLPGLYIVKATCHHKVLKIIVK